jgi:diguanylate cyclase (GGDEF)-like protein
MWPLRSPQPPLNDQHRSRQPLRALWSGDDALVEHRDRIALRLSQLAAAVSVVMWLYQLYSGRVVLVWLLSGAALFLLLNVYSLAVRRRPLVPYGVLTVSLATTACFATWYQGYYGIFWSFPILFGAYFLLPRRQATLIGAGLTLAMTAIAVEKVGWPPALRAFASMGLTLFMISWALGIIGKLQRALREQAITDPLTGAFNRRHLQAELARLSQPGQGVSQSHSLLAIDIDHFKRVNDRFGHAEGDEVLRRLVAAILARKRASDLLFRTGGEEFMLLLYRTSPAQARAIAEDLRERLESHAWLPNGDTVTISIGVNTWRPGQSVDEWMRGADRALYDAKREGRNRVTMAGEFE